MAFPKPDDASRTFFESLVPADDPRVQIRPFFGNVAGFVNRNMFIGLLGSEVFVRLAEEDRALLVEEGGTAMTDPARRHPMREYVVVPEAWRAEPARARRRVARALSWVGAMPAKQPKTRRART